MTTKPTMNPTAGTIFEDVCSNAQLARPVEDRWSLSDEQIVSVRALVRDNTDLTQQVERLRPVVEELIRLGDLSDKCKAKADWTEWPDPVESDRDDELTWGDRIIVSARAAIAPKEDP